ncbi:protein FAM98C [Clarias gariepinus]|uniref:protein FAM98C n=1 Tax=Clarias gariepinus TaxID=13013 RepID=UPI00234C957E|nr:protein FAM98C [Clarias gariepinus]
MEREFGTVAALKALGYGSDLCVSRCECDELPCPLLSWLVLELRKHCPELKGNSGTILARELKEVLRVMLYPYDTLTTETLTPIHLKRITEFLVSELQAVCMLKYRECNPGDTEPLSESGKEQRPRESNPDTQDKTELDDKEVMKELTKLFQALDMDPASQLSDVCSQVESRIASLPEGKVQEPLLKTNLNSTQWSELNQINRSLCKDYDCRRQMMIKRFHVTLQSFAWGERGKERSALMSTVPQFASPLLESSVSVALLLAAREDQSCILPVTAGPSTSIHKVLMGSVPDRGGRPGEIEPPMPMFTRRSEGGDRQREKNKFKRREYSGKKKKNKNR